MIQMGRQLSCILARLNDTYSENSPRMTGKAAGYNDNVGYDGNSNVNGNRVLNRSLMVNRDDSGALPPSAL